MEFEKLFEMSGYRNAQDFFFWLIFISYVLNITLLLFSLHEPQPFSNDFGNIHFKNERIIFF